MAEEAPSAEHAAPTSTGDAGQEDANNAGALDDSDSMMTDLSRGNSFGLVVGKTASQDLEKFLEVFEALAAQTPQGFQLREEGFKLADPNGA